MTNFKATVLSLVLVIGCASAAGCYPAYVPGSANALGTSVSQAITTTTPLVWTACTVGASCPTGWTQTGGVSTTATYNFACNSPYWCSNVGYAPGGVYSALAWTKEAAACSGTAPAVTLAPTTVAPTPVAWSGAGCPDAFVAGGAYVEGSLVAVGNLVYQCKTGAASGWCPLAGYLPGTGTAWPEAWTLKGSCTGTIAPTTLSPTTTQAGCPSAWVSGTVYAAGAMVSAGGKSFRCNAHPMSLFCGQAGYEPNTESFGGAYKLAWTTVGTCSGTIAPSTASPTVTPVFSVAGVCPTAYTSGGAYSAGSKVITVTVTGSNVYECKAYPYSGYCSQVGFEPGTTYGSMGWTYLGICDPNATASPTASPTFTPTSSPTFTPTSSPTFAPTLKPTSTPVV